MSSSKRYSEMHSSALPEKSNSNRNATTASNRSGASQTAAQGNKQRPRFMSGHTNPKLTVPRPVILPSLRKESEKQEGQSHAAAPSAVSQSWQRPEETPVFDPSPWAHHGAARQNLWNRGPHEGHEEHMTGFHSRPPLLNKEEFPSLEAATHSKGALSKTKPHRPVDYRESHKEWADEDQQSGPTALAPRSTWEEDERYGSMGEMHMGAYGPPHLQPPGYVPVMSHGMPSAEYYGHPSYYPARPAYYAAAPAVMQPGYNYGHPGDGYYAPYVHAVYPPPQMAANYPPPDMYPEQGAYPVPPPPQERPHQPVEDVSYEGDEEFEDELRTKAEKVAERLKIEAEHPKTPDNASGEGPVRPIRRQPSGEVQPQTREANHKTALRRQSLPKTSSDQLKTHLDSTELDWEAQVVAEEKFNKKQEIKILTRPSTDTVPSIASSQDNGGTRRGRSEAMAADRWRPAHSPMTRDHYRRDRSADASVRAASEKSVSGRWNREEQWHGQQSGNMTPLSQRTAFTEPFQPEPVLHEGWTDTSEAAPRGRAYRGRGRGTFGGGRNYMPRHEHHLSPAPGPRGRCHFPGRGFRPTTGPPRSAEPPAAPSEGVITFGQFDEPVDAVNGGFDPFSGSRPENRDQFRRGHGRGRAVDVLLRHLNPQKPHRSSENLSEHPIGPAHMDLAGQVPYLGTVLPDALPHDGATPRHSAVSTPTSRSQSRSERGGYRGRSQRGFHRGRSNFRGRFSGGYPHPRAPREPFSPTNASERIASSDVGSRTSEDGRASTSHFRTDRWGSYDDRSRQQRPPGRGFPGRRGRGRGRGRDMGRSFQNYRPQNLERHERAPTSSQRMQWVPKKPFSDAASSGRPAEE